MPARQIFKLHKNKCVKGSTAKSTLAAIEAINYKRMKIYDDIDLYITPSYFYKKKLEESGIIHSEIIHIKTFCLPILFIPTIIPTTVICYTLADSEERVC